jgi:hypothetical protein
MTKRIVEINGVKLEVDLREGQTIETYKVGEIVKLLVPKYNNEFASFIGAVIGFDAFKSHPTIVVAYLDATFGVAKIEMAYIHDGSQFEIVHASEGDVPFSKKQVLDLLEKNITDKANELADAKWRLERFNTWFGKHFSEVAEEAVHSPQ